MTNFDRFGYKAKKTNSKKWLYAGFDDSEELLRWLLRDENNSKYDPAWIDTKTICQCTGIRDSDGQLIYEHDIIEAKDVKGIGFYEKSEVLWDGCEWSKKSRFICSIRGLFDLYENGEVTIKVIGNKFDKED